MSDRFDFIRRADYPEVCRKLRAENEELRTLLRMALDGNEAEKTLAAVRGRLFPPAPATEGTP